MFKPAIRIFATLIIALLLSATAAFAADAPKSGDAVWAQWKPNAWFHGKVAGKSPVGYQIAFDDGDKGEFPAALVAIDKAPASSDVKPGARVLAQWKDGKLYPGTVAGTSAAGVSVRFDDGDSITTASSTLRMLSSTIRPQLAPSTGTIVWAQWKPNAWFHGKVAGKSPVGYQIAFDDGDKGEFPAALVAIDKAPSASDVKPGARVLAQWQDGKLYPGTVMGSPASGSVKVLFDDRDSANVRVQDLRLLNQ